jgi:hypothetical protein
VESFEEECSYLVSGLFGKAMWPTQSNDPVVSVSDVFDTDKIRVAYIDCWNRPNLSYQVSAFFRISSVTFCEELLLGRELLMERVGTLLFA